MSLGVAAAEQLVERNSHLTGSELAGSVLEQHPLAHRAHVPVGVVGDEQQPRQEDLGLGQPEVHAALDATTGRGIAQRPRRPLRADHRVRLVQRRPPDGQRAGRRRRVVDLAPLPRCDRHPCVAPSRSAFTDDSTAGPSHSRIPLTAAVVLPDRDGPTSASAPRSPRRAPRRSSGCGGRLGGNELPTEASHDEPARLRRPHEQRTEVASLREPRAGVHAERTPRGGADLRPAEQLEQADQDATEQNGGDTPCTPSRQRARAADSEYGAGHAAAGSVRWAGRLPMAEPAAEAGTAGGCRWPAARGMPRPTRRQARSPPLPRRRTPTSRSH